MGTLNSLEWFLAKCSGTDTELLEKYFIATDVNKQVGLGGIVLITGIFAGLTFGCC